MGFLKTFVWLTVCYCVLVGCLYLLQRRILYLPSSGTPNQVIAGVPEMRDVQLVTEDGLSLRSWYHPAASNRPTFVYFQGNAASIAERAYKARLWIDRGYGVLLVGYRGYGGNSGSPTETGLYSDGRAALDFLMAEGVVPGTVVLYGESLGSGVAVALASENSQPFAALILESPFTSVADIAASRYWFVPVRRLLWDRFDSLSRLGQVEAPILILHGERDRIVPVAHGRKMFTAAPSPKRIEIFEQAGHSDLFDHGADAAIRRFLRNQAEILSD